MTVSTVASTTEAQAATDSGRTGLATARTPWGESRFWILQLLVLAIALIRLAVTVSFGLDPTTVLLEVSTVVLFVVPVVVASLDYGLSGGVVTVGWVAVLCIPRLVVAADRHESAALWIELLQVVVLGVVAGLVGYRVSTVSASREQADAARRARVRAELLYREMFESNRSPILIVDGDGFVIETNASADRAFGADTGRDGRHRRLVDVIGPRAAAVVLPRLVDEPDDGPDAEPDIRVDTEDGDDRVHPLAFTVSGEVVLFRPTVTLVGSTAGDRRMQVIFEDVTAETRRHDLIEAYANQVVLGQEEERRHIAQELHDGPLQALIHLCRQIDSVDSGPATGHAAAPDATLATMRTTVEDTVAELRSIARGLRPSVLDDLGLVASINQLLTEASAREGFESAFDVTGEVRRLPSAVELALFRITQEAITNVARHAGAGQVTVLLEFGGAGIRVLVTDDGDGFDRARQGRGDDGQSLGLPGMAERARLIGGHLRVTSQVGKGTSVEVRVPDSAIDDA